MFSPVRRGSEPSARMTCSAAFSVANATARDSKPCTQARLAVGAVRQTPMVFMQSSASPVAANRASQREVTVHDIVTFSAGPSSLKSAPFSRDGPGGRGPIAAQPAHGNRALAHVAGGGAAGARSAGRKRAHTGAKLASDESAHDCSAKSSRPQARAAESVRWPLLAASAGTRPGFAGATAPGLAGSVSIAVLRPTAAAAHFDGQSSVCR